MTEEQPRRIELAPLHVRHVEAIVAERDAQILEQKKYIARLQDTLTVMHNQNLEQEKRIKAYDEDLAGHEQTIERREAEVRELSGAPTPIKRKADKAAKTP